VDAAFLGAAVPVAFLVAAIVLCWDLFDGDDRARSDQVDNVSEQTGKAVEELLLWMAMSDGGGGGRAGQVCAMRGDALVLYAGVRVPASL
jgi:hypothetical protein